MTNELTMRLSGRGLAQIRDAAILSYGYRWHNTIHQAIGVYMHWVILGMDLGISDTRLQHLTLYLIRYHTAIYIPSNIRFLGHIELSN